MEYFQNHNFFISKITKFPSFTFPSRKNFMQFGGEKILSDLLRLRAQPLGFFHPRQHPFQPRHDFLLFGKRWKWDFYSNIEIPLPPLSEQKKIVARLERMLARVKEAKRLRAEAQEITQNLLSAELHKIFTGGKSKGWEFCNLGDKKVMILEIFHGSSQEN